MMDETKLPDKYNDGKHSLWENGAIYSHEKGRIVAKLPGGPRYDITAEKSAEWSARRKQVGLIAHMKGLAKGAGIELPEDADLETIVQGAGSAIEAITAHMAKTFISSKNLRGMGESYGKLTAGFVDTDSRAHSEMDTPRDMPQIAILLLQFINQLQEVKEDNSKAVEGEIIEEPKGG